MPQSISNQDGPVSTYMSDYQKPSIPTLFCIKPKEIGQ